VLTESELIVYDERELNGNVSSQSLSYQVFRHSIMHKGAELTDSP